MRFLCLSLTASLMASTALADVTAEDVLAVNKDLFARMGLNVVAETQRTGETLDILGGEIILSLPMGQGSLSMDIPPHAYTETDGGGVRIDWPEEMSIGVRSDLAGIATNYAGTLTIRNQNSVTLVEGTPEDMVFTSTNDGSTVTLETLDQSGPMVEAAATSGPYRSETRIVGGDVMTVTNVATQEAMTITYGVSAPDIDMRATTEAAYGEFQSETILNLPEGMSIFAMGEAFRNGLGLSGTYSYAETRSSGTTIIGEQVQEQSQSTGRSTGAVSITADGAFLEGSVADINFTLNDRSVMPFPVEVMSSGADVLYRLPILASDDAAPFQFRIGLQELAFPEEIWSLFDQTGELPRDPIDFTFDVGGTARLGFDLTDIEYYAGLGPANTPDVAVETVEINEVSAAALNAAMLATGAFTLDNSDLQTIPGFPRPEGQLRITTLNAQRLLDTLERAGLLGRDEIGGARMGLGMFSRVTGDGETETIVEVNALGHVIVNGQRMY